MNDDKYEFRLSDDAKRYAEEVLNETEEIRNKSLIEIKKWLEDQPNLHAKRTTKDVLPFLRGSKFNLDKTKTKLTNFYTMKRDRIEWFTNRDPLLNEIQELARLGVFLPLKSTSNNRTVIIIRPTAHNPKKHDINNVFKIAKMIIDIYCRDNELVQIYGIITLLDMNGATFGHAKQMSVSVIKNAVYAWQNYHCRPQKIEFFNAPIYINVVLNIFRSFMSEKLKKRVGVHFNGLDGLKGEMDLNILPPEYGGKGDTVEELANYWNCRLIEAKEWFIEDEKYKAE